MSSFAETWFGGNAKVDRISRTIKALTGDAADNARAQVRGRVGELIANTEEGQKVKSAYISQTIQGWVKTWGPHIAVAVIAGLALFFVTRKG